MESYFKVLGIESTNSISKIKEAYYKRIKEYTPENNGEEFILINDAYKRINMYLKENEMSKIDFYLERIEKGDEVDKSIDYIKKNINEKNFEYINEKAIEKICCLNKIGQKERAILLTCLLKHKFKKLNLNGLVEAYERLEEVILKI